MIYLQNNGVKIYFYQIEYEKIISYTYSVLVFNNNTRAYLRFNEPAEEMIRIFFF